MIDWFPIDESLRENYTEKKINEMLEAIKVKMAPEE